MGRLLAALSLVLTTGACVIVGDPTCGGGGASVVVTPGVVIVAVGESFTPSASDSWCDGGHTSHGSPQWSLAHASDTAVVSLDATTGRITGRRLGKASVVARSQRSGATSTVSVTVH